MTTSPAPLLAWALSLLPAAAPQPALRPDPCDAFYAALAEAPHVRLVRSSGSFESIVDGETYEGCQVEFETNDSIRGGTEVPDFMAEEGSELYRDGWRLDLSTMADGPGSGSYGIERDSVICSVRWEQPAYIDDDGTLVQSDTLQIRVQCREAAGSG